MTDQIWIAPTGAPIAGVAQTDQGIWQCTWQKGDSPEPLDYAADGPEAEWEAVEIGGETVFVDSEGAQWFARHLIPGDLPGRALSDDACGMMANDFLRHHELQLIDQAIESMDVDRAGEIFLTQARGLLQSVADVAKATAAEIKRNETVLARASVAIHERLLTDREIVALANEMATQVLFDCYGMVTHGSTLVVDRPDPRCKQAWQAVAIVFERLRGTEINEALENVRGEG